jgi:hypothetical protein
LAACLAELKATYGGKIGGALRLICITSLLALLGVFLILILTPIALGTIAVSLLVDLPPEQPKTPSAQAWRYIPADMDDDTARRPN